MEDFMLVAIVVIILVTRVVRLVTVIIAFSMMLFLPAMVIIAISGNYCPRAASRVQRSL